ncbi:MAG: hypothetical protein U0441_18140 [Polyangiaceae bacterium]
MLRFVRIASIAVAAAALAGCATRYIPNTDVEDSDDNRKVITFCERYRHDVELKDVGDLLKLASKEYYEDGGNVDASDDLDYAGLKEYLTSRFDNARAIRYEMRYRRIVHQQLPPRDEDSNNNPPKNEAGADAAELIYVDYTYSASYRIPAAKGGDEWRRRVEDNRLEILRYSDNSYRIIAGM